MQALNLMIQFLIKWLRVQNQTFKSLQRSNSIAIRHLNHFIGQYLLKIEAQSSFCRKISSMQQKQVIDFILLEQNKAKKTWSNISQYFNAMNSSKVNVKFTFNDAIEQITKDIIYYEHVNTYIKKLKKVDVKNEKHEIKQKSPFNYRKITNEQKLQRNDNFAKKSFEKDYKYENMYGIKRQSDKIHDNNRYTDYSPISNRVKRQLLLEMQYDLNKKKHLVKPDHSPKLVNYKPKTNVNRQYVKQKYTTNEKYIDNKKTQTFTEQKYKNNIKHEKKIKKYQYIFDDNQQKNMQIVKFNKKEDIHPITKQKLIDNFIQQQNVTNPFVKYFQKYNQCEYKLVKNIQEPLVFPDDSLQIQQENKKVFNPQDDSQEQHNILDQFSKAKHSKYQDQTLEQLLMQSGVSLDRQELSLNNTGQFYLPDAQEQILNKQFQFSFR